MKPVNLLPQRHRPAGAPGGKRGNGHLALGALAALLAITVLYVLTANAVTARKDETVRLEREAALAEARAAALGDYGDFRALKNSRTTAVRDLAAGRFDHERLLRELGRVLPSGVRLTSVDASAPAPTTTGGSPPAPGAAAGAAPADGATAAGGATARLAGCARDHRTVATVLVRLRSLHRADKVSLSESSHGGGEGEPSPSGGGGGSGCAGRTAHSWNATVTFTEAGRATDPAGAAPAALGGGA